MEHKGYRFDPDSGIVYGLHGRPFTCKRNGYVQVKRRNFQMQAHLLIWEALHGPIPKRMQINHKNGIKWDNRIANLEMVTPQENTLHAYRMGLRSAVGEENGRARLTRDQAKEIYENTQDNTQALADRYGVGRRTIRDIKDGLTWTSVTRSKA